MSFRTAGDKSRVKFEGCWSGSRLKLISWQRHVFSPEGPDIRRCLTQTRFRTWWMTRNFRDPILSLSSFYDVLSHGERGPARTWRYLTARGKTVRDPDGTGLNSEQPRPTSVLCARVVPTLIVYIISLSHTGVQRSEESSCLRCR